MHFGKALLISSAVVLSTLVQAQVSPSAFSGSSQIDSGSSSSLDRNSPDILTNEEKSLAKQWMLEESDWTKYKQIMSGPRGVWSPGLDPLTALGVSETDPKERARYAEIWMKVESRRMELELAFEVERQKAAQQLLGTKPVIDNREWIEDWNRKYNSMTQYIGFFVTDDCLEDCEDLFHEVSASVSRTARLDIWFAGDATAESIGHWANHMKIDPEIVRARKVTLNFESGKAAEFGVDLSRLPAVKVMDVETGQIRDYE